MYLSELLNDTEFNIIQGEDQYIKSITIDSRKAEEGSLFICIKGITSDGHDYIEKAAENGAKAIICDKQSEQYPAGLTVVLVNDSREVLNTIASNFYGKPQESLIIIGVTGTNGKTSTTYFLETILKMEGIKCGVIGTTGVTADGNPLNISYATSTTPDTIELYEIFAEMRKRGITHIIMEVSSHALELKKVDGIKFESAVFTNLTQDHLDFHKTFENYANAKAKLFRMCRWGIINADDKSYKKIIADSTCEKATYSIDEDSDYRAYNIKYAQNGSSFDLRIFGDEYSFILNIPGKFSIYNALAAIVTCINLGMPVRTIIYGVSKIENVAGRIQPIPNTKGFNIFVDYAHTPDGLENIIKAVKAFTKGRVITLFGCGGDRDTAKRPIMGKIAGGLSDICIITSDNPRSEEPDAIIEHIEKGIKETNCEYIKQADRREAIFEAVKIARQGDSVIIAGKGHEDYQEFENKRRIHFDDATVAREALEGIE